MRWLNASASRLASAFILASFMLLPASSTVYAVNSEVNAIICNGGAGAAIVINQPQNDSVISQPVLTLSGTVENTSQIEILVDDQYSATISVGSQQLTYSTDVSLPEGTHTVKLIANALCQTGDAEASIVVTYNPATVPSDGSTTPTDVDNGGVSIGINSGAESGIVSDENVTDVIARFGSVPVIGTAASVAVNALNESGLDVTAQDGFAVAAVRVGLTVAAVSLVVFGGTIAPMVIPLSPQLTQLYIGNKHRVLMYSRWFLRLGALPLLMVVYFL